MTVPRGAPCPCGSGKKYKNCCLKREQIEAIRKSPHRGAIERAIGWLEARHPRAMLDSIEHGFIGMLDEPERHRLRDIPPDIAAAFQSNSLEWLLAQGDIEIRRGGARVRMKAMDLILGPGGPFLNAPQRAFLEQMPRHDLSLYEVVECRPGEGMTLRDLLHPEHAEFRVKEISASEQLVAWDIIGTRLVPFEDHWEIAGSIFSYGSQAPEIARRLREELDGLRAASGDAEARASAAELVTRTLVSHWLLMVAEPPAPPRLMDVSGEPLMLVTDHYEVLDWDVLAHRLEAEPDIEGDRRDGWVRFAETGGELRRSLLAINVGKRRNRLEPFARTMRLAEEGKAWLERVAGDSIRFLVRDAVDPATVLRKGEGSPRRKLSEDLPDIPAEEKQRIFQRLALEHYKNWAIEPIPMLGDKTPMEAMKTESGRGAVRDLLKHYESMEAHRARDEDCDPVDYGFLWKQVGLDREFELSRS